MDTRILSRTNKEEETRTTCKLTLEGVAALERLREEFGLKQKGIFDLLVNEKWILEDMLLMAGSSSEIKSVREIRKSLVITKKNLKVINDAANKSGLSRDVVIDAGLKNLVLILQKLRNRQNEKYKKSQMALNDLCSQASITENELENFLDNVDPIKSRFSIIMAMLMNLINEIDLSIKKGTTIDPGWA